MSKRLGNPEYFSKSRTQRNPSLPRIARRASVKLTWGLCRGWEAGATSSGRSDAHAIVQCSVLGKAATVSAQECVAGRGCPERCRAGLENLRQDLSGTDARERGLRP